MLRTNAIAALCLLATAARAEEIDYKKLYAAAAPSVVLVYGTEGNVGSIGSGSVIRSDGLVITNAHVILNHDTARPWPKLFIYLKPERVTGADAQDLKSGYEAQLLVSSAQLDLALLRIVNPPGGLPVLPISDDSGVGVGEATAAIGHPEKGSKWSLTTGRIGGEWNDFDGVKGKDVYQMETSVNRGNSGGPLLDGNGHMVGINTSIARRSADGLAITGVNFAVKSSVVRKWIADKGEELGAAPVVNPATPPAPAQVATAAAAPDAQETVPTAGTPPIEPLSEIAYVQKQPDQGQSPTPDPVVPISVTVPAAPMKGRHGFRSREPIGKILSAAELVRQHAREAFEDLEEESAKHRR